ncbi:MAG TPA: PKD domain-containing protein [Thermoanaerobaculia bacterium]|nr:PKD domain-containing protein [Thermoanaerobaculia bacterium]
MSIQQDSRTRGRRTAWLAALALVLLWPLAGEAGELVLRSGSTPFSGLDGGAADADGTADGTLTLDRLEVAGNAVLAIDVPVARIEVAGDVVLAGNGAIRAAGDQAPQVTLQAAGSVRLSGHAVLSADAPAGGGSLRLCAGGDLVLAGNSAVSADALDGAGAGGELHLETAGRLVLADATVSVRTNGATGGRITLVSCDAGVAGPGRSLGSAAVTVAGRAEAVGTAGAGGTVEIEARQGGVAFAAGLAAVDARGTAGDGSVAVTAALGIEPAVPPASPGATTTPNGPSDEPCDCSTGGGEPPGVGALVVAADVDRPTGLPGTSFTFSGRVVQSTAAVTDWQWTLTDGRAFSGQTASAAFDAPGLHGATLTVTDEEGTVFTNQVGVVVFDPATQAPPELGMPVLLGDVDGDGAVTLRDAHRVAKHTGRLELLATAFRPAADMDLDGNLTLDDSLLLGKAVAANSTVPSALLPSRGAPGTRVTLVSPELLDPNALIEVEVGSSAWVQMPPRVVKGYATITIPFDATRRNSMQVTPGPVAVRILRDGVVAETLTFEVEAPAPLPADPKAELLSFLADYTELFSLNRQALAALLEHAGVDGEQEELLLATFTAAEQDMAMMQAELAALLAGPGGDELAELWFRVANANGYPEFRQRLDDYMAEHGSSLAANIRRAAATGGADVDAILAIVCAVTEATELLETGGNILGYVCDGLLVAAVIAVAVPADGPVVDAALLFAWASGCGTVEVTVEMALLINELVGGLEPDLRFAASPTSPGPGESVELRAEVEIAGLDDVCAYGVGKGRDELIEDLAEEVVERLLRKKLALKAIAKAAELVSQDLFEELEERLEVTVVRALNDTAIGDMLDELTTRVCDIFQLGVPLLDDLSEIMEGPDPNVGQLTFAGDGTATYTCPDDGSSTADGVTFTVRREICDETVEETATVSCETRPVTITMGDNGSANDDIYEVRIGGETVLTSSSPVRAISTTVQLPVGEHTVQMIGRAAPDGIGTYYISFSGATVIGGAATSGSDLTPGVVKTFILRVQ